jgi:hypothetical protein
MHSIFFTLVQLTYPSSADVGHDMMTPSCVMHESDQWEAEFFVLLERRTLIGQRSGF